MPSVPINYSEQLAAEAAKIAERITAPTSDRIKLLKSKHFLTPDGQESDELEGVVVEFMTANMYYDGPYNMDNPQPPACFAIGPSPSELVPSDNSPDKQSETCSTCPQNQFGSALTGRGKACKNRRLLAFVPEAHGEDETPPVYILAVPPTSLREFDGYVQKLAYTHGTTPAGVVTRVSMDPNSDYVSPRFSVVRILSNEELGIYLPRREEAVSRLTKEPDVSQYTPPARKRR